MRVRPTPPPERRWGGFSWPQLAKNRAYILKVFFRQGFLEAFGFCSVGRGPRFTDRVDSAVRPWGTDFSGRLGWTPSQVGKRE